MQLRHPTSPLLVSEVSVRRTQIVDRGGNDSNAVTRSVNWRHTDKEVLLS